MYRLNTALRVLQASVMKTLIVKCKKHNLNISYLNVNIRKHMHRNCLLPAYHRNRMSKLKKILYMLPVAVAQSCFHDNPKLLLYLRFGG